MPLNYFIDVVYSSPIVSTTLALLFGLLCFILKNRNLPPGPIGLPLVGYWPFLREDGVHLQLQEIGKKYGDVYSFNVTGTLFIHLGSIKAIKEAHVTKSDCFKDRYTQYSILSIFFGDGIISLNGEAWRALRKFFLQAFREYGLSSLKEHMSGPIYDTVSASIDTLKATNGSPVNIISILNDKSTCIFRRMVFNDGEITDEELKAILECYQNLFVIFKGSKILLMGEIARYFIFPRIEGYKFAHENHKKMTDYLEKLVRNHERTYNEDNIRDIVDSYLRERNQRRKRGDPTAEFFTEKALVSSLVQIVGDGILSVAIFIAYFIHALLENPEEQERIYKELVDVVGTDRQVTLEDRNKLPYTNAFMQEVMRTTDFFPIFPSMECTKETTINGYRIPKGSVTLMNMWASQRDPKTFVEPDEFRPSRYLSEPGKPKAETSVLFGLGKRSCAGEAFTMMQIFLFVTTFVKNFRLERPKGSTKTDFLDGVMEICAHLRK